RIRPVTPERERRSARAASRSPCTAWPSVLARLPGWSRVRTARPSTTSRRAADMGEVLSRWGRPFDILVKRVSAAASRPGRPMQPAGDPAGWTSGANHSPQQWRNKMLRRGWTPEQITEAIAAGQKVPAVNLVNPGNAATRHVHPTTGRSVVVDDVTREVIHVGG